jgi:hypothetical protein
MTLHAFSEDTQTHQLLTDMAFRLLKLTFVDSQTKKKNSII